MKGRRAGLLAALLLAAAGPAGAEPAEPLEPTQVLERVREGWRRDRARIREREAEFARRRDEQARLLEEAEARREGLERRSEALEARFREGEETLAELEARREERLGDLGELIGVVRLVAGQARGELEASLTSVDRPGRAESLAELAGSRRLPGLDELENLWVQLLDEAVAQGRVVRFEAPVIDADGEQRQREVVRFGAFNTVSEGRYLVWDSEAGHLAEAPRQPPGRFLAALDPLRPSEEGLVRVALDPARGAILARLVEAPGFFERIAQGGLIGVAILVLGGAALVLALQRIASLSLQGRRVAAQKGRAEVSRDNSLGRVMAVYEECPGLDLAALEHRLDEAILRESTRLERGLWAIRVVSVAAPLMGLLGTVSGMIRTFQSITLFGTGDPRMMAGGISEALVTTLLGLSVAIPLVLLHSWVSSLSRDLVSVLDEQSSGLVAQRAEQARGSGS